MNVLLLLFVFWGYAYSVFSYALTDPNLYILQTEWYIRAQTWMWQTFFMNAPVLTAGYVLLIASGFLLYFFVYKRLHTSDGSNLTNRVESCLLYRTTTFSFGYLFSHTYRRSIIFFVALVLPLLFSYNALSHDVFNYMFNAKMVVTLGANPHQQVALDFQTDPWLRFMHNTHTPAPYGYGWTALSVIPYLTGFGTFFVTWLSFRLFSVLSIVLLYVALQYFSVEMRRKYLSLSELFLVFCNPLLLIEVVSNSHNDLWMMVFAVASFAVLFSLLRKKYVPSQLLTVSAALLLVSISIKFATIVLLLPWFLLLIVHAFKLYLLEKVREKITMPFVLTLLNGISNVALEKFFAVFPFICSVLLCIPLLTTRSQQFHPWYLLWAFIWIPFIKNTVWRVTLLTLTVSSMLRYIPWLWTGGFEGNVLLNQKLITWVTLGVVLVAYYGITFKKKPQWWA